MKVLVFYLGLCNPFGGTERVIMNLYRHIREGGKVQFDFLVYENGYYDEEIKANGDKIYYIDRSENFRKQLKSFFTDHLGEYDVVHAHMNKDVGTVLEYAMKYGGVKHRIAHSHNARQNVNPVIHFLKMIQEWKMETYATDYWGCTKAANEWYFPRKHDKGVVINNGIEVEKYQYCNKKRCEIRKELHISDDSYVITNIGRYVEQKNQSFLMQVTKNLVESGDKNLVLVLAGSGDRSELEAIAESLQIQDYVRIIGGRNDVGGILSASDLFVFPSLWEGLGIVLIEAQANGLDSLASTFVPQEADIGVGLVEYLPLQAQAWESDIMKHKYKGRSVLSEEKMDKVRKQYSIEHIAEDVKQRYLRMADK